MSSLIRRLVLPQLLAVLALAFAPSARAADWVTMDLGEIVVTGTPDAGYTYVPDAWDRIAALRDAGFKVALLTNIPERWGARCGDKYAELQNFLGTRLHEKEPFPWKAFDAVIVPPFDRYRKPAAFMYVAALETACTTGGRTLFIGEEAQERAAATAWGIGTFLDDAGEARVPTPAEARQALDDSYNFQAPDRCDFSSLYAQTLARQDAATGVAPCVIVP